MTENEIMLNKILEQTMELNGKVGKIIGQLEGHSTVHEILQKRMDGFENKDKKTYFNQTVHYTKGVGVISMFLYGLYNIMKQIGIK